MTECRWRCFTVEGPDDHRAFPDHPAVQHAERLLGPLLGAPTSFRLRDDGGRQAAERRRRASGASPDDGHTRRTVLKAVAGARPSRARACPGPPPRRPDRPSSNDD